MRRIEARRRKVRPLRLRFFQSFASRRHQFNHPIERSTIHLLGQGHEALGGVGAFDDFCFDVRQDRRERL